MGRRYLEGVTRQLGDVVRDDRGRACAAVGPVGGKRRAAVRPKAHDQLYTISVEVSRDRIVWSAPAFDDWGLQRRIMSPHRIEDVADESLAYFLKYHYGSDPTRMPAYIRVRA